MALRKILKAYRTVFVVFLAWTIDRYGKESAPVSMASSALSFSEFCALIWLIGGMGKIVGVFHFQLGPKDIVIASGVAIYIVIEIANYFLCVFRKAYRPLLDDFNAKGERYRKRAFALMWGWLWGDTAAFMIVGLVAASMPAPR